MDQIKVLFLGARGKTCQVMRIEESFRKFDGFTILDEQDESQPDIIYANDAGYFSKAISIKELYFNKPKIILNVLDLFSHLKEEKHDAERAAIGAQIKKADEVTTIASYCVDEIRNLFGIESKLIFNPMIPVSQIEGKDARFKVSPTFYRFLFAGRNCDPNRRVSEGIKALLESGFSERNFVSFGSENIGFGTFYGLVSEQEMNTIYNNSQFLLFPSYYSGLGLPVVEAIGAGMIPLCCADMTTLQDILPEDKFPEYYKYRNSSPQENIRRLFTDLFTKNFSDHFISIRKRLIDHYNSDLLLKYSPESVALKLKTIIIDLYAKS